MTSRLRRLDKSILRAGDDYGEDEPTSHVLLDIDEQEDLIQSLQLENQETYTTYKKYLLFMIRIQLPCIILLELMHRQRDLQALLILLSLLMTLINIQFETAKFDPAVVVSHRPTASAIGYLVDHNSVINGMICIQLVYLFIVAGELTKMYYLLPLINFGSLQLFRVWFSSTSKDVELLNSLKYKYKNV